VFPLGRARSWSRWYGLAEGVASETESRRATAPALVVGWPDPLEVRSLLLLLLPGIRRGVSGFGREIASALLDDARNPQAGIGAE
jgi:hypothetical protein